MTDFIFQRRSVFVILFSLATTLGCQTVPPPADVPETPPAPPAATAVPTESTTNPQTATAPAPEPKKLGALIPPKGVEPEKALGWLKNGNTRFVTGRFRKDGQSTKDVARLTKGQKPHTIVLACSDSRVPPELVFDQKLGELYVIRTSGQALDKNVIGSVEYAAQALGPRLILVLGHTSCGTVKMALNSKRGGTTGSANMDEMLKDLHPRLQAEGAESPQLKDEAVANAKGIVSDLLSRSAVLKELADSQHIQLKTAIYDVSTGRVEF